MWIRANPFLLEELNLARSGDKATSACRKVYLNGNVLLLLLRDCRRPAPPIYGTVSSSKHNQSQWLHQWQVQIGTGICTGGKAHELTILARVERRITTCFRKIFILRKYPRARAHHTLHHEHPQSRRQMFYDKMRFIARGRRTRDGMVTKKRQKQRDRQMDR